ncbi:60S acidic ribosomal protein P2-like [Impatiens glandulifera]|uniref:60S acidic ribosomal protein P2-like n=1 Tax=Impatiens glandulifera TaxID=253017 RepID=UPI001FB04E59|nr:60S acidic ribosomal protein P2-like [Impatiens glandulifera]
MKVIAACLLAVLGGKISPTAEDIKEILASVGADADNAKIELLMSQIKGKDIAELIANGMEMLASVPSGGGAAAAAPSGGAVSAAVAVEQKKEEKVEAKEESDEEDFSFNLFD